MRVTDDEPDRPAPPTGPATSFPADTDGNGDGDTDGDANKDGGADTVAVEAPPAPSRLEQITPRRVFAWAVAAAIGVLVVYLGALFLYGVRDLLVLITVAAFIAMSLDPLVRWLIRHKVGRRYAVTVIFLLFFVILGVVMWQAVPPLAKEATELATDFPKYLDELRQRSPTLRDLEARFDLKPRVDEFATTFVDRIQGDALAFGQRFLGALLQALLVIVLTIYFMADLPRIRRAIVRLFPTRSRPQVSHTVNLTIDKVGAYMIGNLLISFIAGVTTYIALALIGVPFPLPLAVFVAVTDLIPLIGATLGAVVCTIVAVATTDLWPEVVLVVIFFVAYQQLENYVIAPMVLRNSVDMSSVAVLLAALLGGSRPRPGRRPDGDPGGGGDQGAALGEAAGPRCGGGAGRRRPTWLGSSSIHRRLPGRRRPAVRAGGGQAGVGPGGRAQPVRPGPGPGPALGRLPPAGRKDTGAHRRQRRRRRVPAHPPDPLARGGPDRPRDGGPVGL